MFKKMNDNGQMLVIAAVFIAVSLVLLTAVSSRLNYVETSANRGSTLSSEYQNVRKKFGEAIGAAFDDNFEEIVENDFLCDYFDRIENIFSFLEMQHNYVFSAQYIDVFYNNNEPDGIEVKLTLSNGSESLSEEVKYYL